MPMYQAYGCTFRPGEGNKKSAFSIPNPLRDREKCAQWLHNIGTDKFDIRTYKYSRNRVVCEDHFEQDCFLEDVRAKVMGYAPRKKLLKPDAVPTIFIHRPPSSERSASKRRREQSDREKLLKSLLGEAKVTSEASQDEQSHHALQVSVNDPHDGDESDLPDVNTFPSFSDFTDQEVPEPCQFVTVNTEAADKRKFPASEGNPRKKKRRRRQSGPGKRADSSTQTPQPTYKNATIQTEQECDDRSTQCPECEVASPSPFDHEYASHTPDHPSLFRIDVASVVQEEEANKEKMPVRQNPTLVHTPDPSQQLPSPTQAPTANQKKTPELKGSLQQTALFMGASSADVSSTKVSSIMPAPVPVPRTTHALIYSSSTSTGTSASGVSLSRKRDISKPTDSQYSEPSQSSPHSPLSSSTSHSEQVSSGSKNDPSYVPSDFTSDCDEEEEAWLGYCVDPKYVVFGSQIDCLLYSLDCPKCYGGHISDLKRNVQGTLLTVSVYCVCGNLVTRWDSQPKIGQASIGNLLCAASALFSGQTHETLDFFSSILNLEFLGHSLYNDIQDEWLFSAINSAYKANVEQARREAGIEPIIVCGDGRCDSPGYSAKYCSYTMMEMHTNKILAMALVQVSEATSSVAMEKLGFKRTMQELLDAGVTVGTVATDRHVGIRKLVREEYPTIEHQFDVWHISKSITKKLLAKSKRKENADLGPWVKCITNHLWWAATNCNQDAELLIEMWQSITHHVCNIHSWNSADKFHECRHEPLAQDEVRKTKWLIPDSPPHQALQEVLFDKNLVKDIHQLTKACRTGDLEAYHNMLLKYCPKRKHFPYAGMLARLQLAVLDHNHNSNRGQRKIKKGAKRGEGQFDCKFSKRSQSWVVGISKEKKDYSYLLGILQNVLKMRDGEMEVHPVEIPDLPVNVAPVPRPPKEELVSQMYSRFTK